MIRTVGFVIVLAGLIYVRGTSSDTVPIWSGWWWAWIIATCLVAWCGGYIHAQVHRNHRDRR